MRVDDAGMVYPGQKPPRSGTAVAAGVIHFICCGLGLLVGAIGLMIAVFAGSSSSNTARTVSGLLGFVCFIVLVVAAVLIWVGIEFTKCKQWARITLIVVYTLSAVSSLTRLMAGGTVATGILIDIVMLMLLFAPSTARDFSPHQYVGGWAPQRVPGWYPDPSGSPQQRYWNGTSWTEHVHQG